MKTAEWMARRRREWCGNNGSLVNIGKWSDGVQRVVVRDGAREESEEVITRSRMWPVLWVGKSTCWVRLNEDRTDRIWEVRWSLGLSRCRLKSPVIINSCGVVAAMERKEVNSSRKQEKGSEKEDEDVDGRYWRRIPWIVIAWELGRHFKWGEVRKWGGYCVKGSRMRKPVPPPVATEDLWLAEVRGKIMKV